MKNVAAAVAGSRQAVVQTVIRINSDLDPAVKLPQIRLDEGCRAYYARCRRWTAARFITQLVTLIRNAPSAIRLRFSAD